MPQTAGKKKDDVLTFMQVVCAFAVVFMHTNGDFWHYSKDSGTWPLANAVECLCYFAVPVFFMITGITLIDYRDRYSTKEFFKKRFNKTVVPYVVWTVIGAFYLHSQNKFGAVTVPRLVGGLLNSDIIDIYWFFLTLFCIYLSMPLFSAVDKAKRKETFEYLFVAALLLNIIVPFVMRLRQTDSQWKIHIDAVSGNLMWVLAGVLLYCYPLSRKKKYVIVGLGAAGLLTHMIGTYCLTVQAGSVVSTFKGYNNPPSVFYACGAFLVLEKLGRLVMAKEPIRKAVDFLGKYTFAIYLMHWYILDYARTLFEIDEHSLLWRFGSPFVIIALCVGVAWLIRKVPVLRRILP